MIKELGTIGLYIKFNESASAAFKFLEIFSSSAASTSLFSASTSSSRLVSQSSSAARFYSNGASANSVYDNEWQHITFTFSPKLTTSDTNDFLIRLGNENKSNINIQNLYIISNTLSAVEVQNLHNEFTGAGTNITVGYSASKSITFIDKIEGRHSSSVTGTVFLPYSSQQRFIGDVYLATNNSASAYLTSSIQFRNTYFDGYTVSVGDRILSLQDNAVYQLQSTNLLSLVSSSNGDYVRVLEGVQHRGSVFVKTSGSFTLSPFVQKIVYYLDSQ